MIRLALRMTMPKETKKVVGWLGFKRDIKYVNVKPLSTDEELNRQENYWNEAAEISKEEEKILEKIKELLETKPNDEILLGKKKVSAEQLDE
jgi:hypothetical protein